VGGPFADCAQEAGAKIGSKPAQKSSHNRRQETSGAKEITRPEVPRPRLIFVCEFFKKSSLTADTRPVK
jgi:hypothetical protein